ncbi:PEP-CTERM sorting domain-containing protein [methane-oxidizing endosymbiont of Gigantopelta aegis]|uniref:PEP-CTERM sorting domain-containing protein n=1 Tax=methane-oxidizing endosymbiont of Gigantopelta aegis TaxID=2794938 RepID=UPI0018DE1A19|nr:PEP-CTERM sorting domain-containing protein [methane-oxidizing endosymbiont of Gigantopelta aegis]
MLKNKICTLAVVAGLLSGGGVSAAGLQNGDFSSNFDNWSGQVDYIDDYTASQMNAVTTPDFFTIEGTGGEAKLSTNYDFITGIGWAVTMFQDFTMPTLSAAGNSLWLDFDFMVQLDDIAGGDNWFAQIGDGIGPLIDIDIAGAGPFDVTSFAGLNVQILFGLENMAGGDDWLKIDNITITEQMQANNVPEPGVFALLGLGVLMLRRKNS